MYYIYHIQGVKIGCSTQPTKRVQNQGYSNFEILEEHSDINVVSDRELELQKHYGYKVDTVPYHISINNRRAYNQSDREKGHETMRKNGFFNEWYKKGNASRKRQVVKYDKQTNELIEIFNSVTDAANSINRPNSTSKISKCCNNPNISYMGFRWKYPTP
jgi:hypothetical protein